MSGSSAASRIVRSLRIRLRAIAIGAAVTIVAVIVVEAAFLTGAVGPLSYSIPRVHTIYDAFTNETGILSRYAINIYYEGKGALSIQTPVDIQVHGAIRFRSDANLHPNQSFGVRFYVGNATSLDNQIAMIPISIQFRQSEEMWDEYEVRGAGRVIFYNPGPNSLTLEIPIKWQGLEQIPVLKVFEIDPLPALTEQQVRASQQAESYSKIVIALFGVLTGLAPFIGSIRDKILAERKEHTKVIWPQVYLDLKTFCASSPSYVAGTPAIVESTIFHSLELEDRNLRVRDRPLQESQFYEEVMEHISSGYKKDFRSWFQAQNDSNQYIYSCFGFVDGVAAEVSQSLNIAPYYYTGPPPNVYCAPYYMAELIYNELRFSIISRGSLLNNLRIEPDGGQFRLVCGAYAGLVVSANRADCERGERLMRDFVADGRKREEVRGLIEQRTSIEKLMKDFLAEFDRLNKSVISGVPLAGYCNLCPG